MAESNPETGADDPEKILQQLEVELILKRAQRVQAKARSGNIRALSFAFLALVLLGALVGFYLLMSSDRLQEMRTNAADRAANASPTPAATAP